MKASFKKAIAAAAAVVTALCGMAVGVGAASADDSTPHYASTESGKLTVHAPNGTAGHTLTAYLVAAYNKDYAAYTDADGADKAGKLNYDTFRYVVNDKDEKAIKNALGTAEPSVTFAPSGSQTAAEEGLKSLTGASDTSKSFYGYTDNTNAASATERKFADALADQITAENWTPTSWPLTLGQENTLTPEGLYLVIDAYKQDDDKVANSTQSVPMLVGTTFAKLTDAGNKALGVGTIDMKNTTAPITKQVVTDKDGTAPNNKPSYKIGDTVYFQLGTTIPNFTGYASDSTLDPAKMRQFNIVDYFQPGSFSFTDQSVLSVTDKTKSHGLSEGTDYVVTLDKDKNTLTVGLEKLVNGADGAYPDWDAGDDIVVIVSATLAQGATTTDSPTTDPTVDKHRADPNGNYNKVELNYSNNPSDNSKKNTVPGPTVNVYSFNLNLKKVGPNGPDGKPTHVPGAGFTVTKNNGKDTVKFTQQNGAYVVDPTGSISEVLSDDKGNISIKGLDADTYTVEETKVPSGYFSGARPTFTVQIDDTPDTAYTNDKSNTARTGSATQAGDDWLTELTYKFTSDSYNLVTQDTKDKDGFTVKNVKSFIQLPKTGAAGIAFFSFIGLALIAAAAFFAIRARKAAKIA